MKGLNIKVYNPALKPRLFPIFKQYPEMFFGSDLETIEKRLSQKSGPAYPKFYAEVDGQPIGFISYFKARDSDDIWFLSWFAVDKSWQNQGIGRKLLAYIERQIAESPTPRLYIETVKAGDPVTQKAQAFYEKCGYRQVGLIPGYYGKECSKAFYFKDLGKKNN